jgi:hypothetical protein
VAVVDVEIGDAASFQQVDHVPTGIRMVTKIRRKPNTRGGGVHQRATIRIPITARLVGLPM